MRKSGVFTLDLGLYIVDGIGRLHLKGDSLAREGLDENLHGGLRVRLAKVESSREGL